MSQPRSQGGMGGSVKRARELMEAGLPPDYPSPPRQNGLPRATGLPAGPKKPMPASLSASRNGGGQSIGVAISRPTQVPQWPLPQGNTSQGNGGQRGPTPQRPPRPSQVPSILDNSRLQDHTPAFQYTAQQEDSPSQDVEHDMNDIRSPLTASSRPSTQSSFGSIPDFPVPLPGPPNQTRRSANLGPPPSARRGASSYYSNISYVSPIQEESPRVQSGHESYASSAAIPSVWRDDTSDFDDYDDEKIERTFLPDEAIIEEGRDSRQSTLDDNDERNLIRSASIGRRGKPAMVTTKSQEKVPTSPNSDDPNLAKMGFVPMEMRAAEMRAAAAAHANAAGMRPYPQPIQDPLASGTGLIDASSSDSSVPRVLSTTSIPIAISTDTRMAGPPYEQPPLDPRMSQILHAHQAASGVEPGEFEEKPELERSLSKLAAGRRPPRLNMDVVREAEARGSLTSLPDLIRRATKLAGMIDKGKRPGSRLNNLNDFDDVGTSRAKEERGYHTRRQSGLSGMLAAFPPPGLATPRENSPHLQSYFPSSNDASTKALNSKPRKKPGRRCCGLPLWVFILIVLFTLGIIAAAVLVPLTLLVFNKSKSTPSTPSALSQCQQTVACLNGGTNILVSDVCSCICANGFTGSTCATAGAKGCTSMNISGTNNTSYSNVTLGDAIPRLVSEAQANFSIPLSSDLILARFSAANMSCDIENSLVTFDGQSKRNNLAQISSAKPTQTAAPVLRRDRSESPLPIGTASSVLSISTSLPPNIQIDTGPAPTNTRTSVSFSGTNPTGKATPTPVLAKDFVVDDEVLDFARVVVLYVLQEQKFDFAVTAHDKMQTFLEGVENNVSGVRAASGNVTVGNGNVVDFLSRMVSLAGKSAIGALHKREVKASDNKDDATHGEGWGADWNDGRRAVIRRESWKGQNFMPVPASGNEDLKAADWLSGSGRRKRGQWKGQNSAPNNGDGVEPGTG